LPINFGNISLKFNYSSILLNNNQTTSNWPKRDVIGKIFWWFSIWWVWFAKISLNKMNLLKKPKKKKLLECNPCLFIQQVATLNHSCYTYSQLLHLITFFLFFGRNQNALIELSKVSIQRSQLLIIQTIIVIK